jgi:hypothetical protein
MLRALLPRWLDAVTVAVTVALGALATGGCGGAAGAVRPAPFRARPDTVVRGDLRGPFSGRVMDGETDRPVQGALVYASWRFVAGAGFSAPHGYREWIGSTDALGRYLVPRLDGGVPGGLLSDFHLLVYKRGYVSYRSDRRFDDLGAQTEFAQQGANLALARWRPDLSHARHLRYVGGGAAVAALTAWEIPEATAELGGALPRAVAEAPAATPADRLDASKLLGPSDIKDLTGYEGAFDVGELGDEPRSATYDTLHLQARGKDEGYDVALRMWRLPPDEAEKHFERLLGDLPGAQAKNELGDKSLRAATAGGDILGLAYFDRARGVVVLIQCGASQCRTHETVLALARVVKNRVDAHFGRAGGAK